MTYKNTFGNAFRIHSFGESHGAALGVVIDGCPSGLKLDEDLLRAFLARRRPGQNQFVTARNEADHYEILSGVYKGVTLGTPIAMIFKNTNQRSEDYDQLTPRSGHADQAWADKYQSVDLRGGGRSSGRETVSRVAAGAIARTFLLQVNPELKIQVWVDQIGEIKNTASFTEFEKDFDVCKGLNAELGFPDATQIEDLKSLLLQSKEHGESYGGRVKIKIQNVSKGLGQPVFSKLKSDLASALFSIGAVNSVSMGDENVFKKGTQYHADLQAYGGVQGGISTGQDMDFSVLIKPTSSILDVAKQGRHDPCILPRAIVVIESMVALVLADHHLLKRLDNIN